MEYEFGVMSNKWSLEAEDMFTAYIIINSQANETICMRWMLEKR